MAKQVRPWLTKPDTNHEPRVRAPDEASTSLFHQGQRNGCSSIEGRIYGCNLHLLKPNQRDCFANRGASIYGSLWPLANDLPVFPNVDARAMHARSLPCLACRSLNCPGHSREETL